MIGRNREVRELNRLYNSNKAELVAVYGRRRVGKTFLIKEYFNNSFAFYATGLSNTKTREQLKVFNGSLIEYGLVDDKQPKDWYEAFMKLKNFFLMIM